LPIYAHIALNAYLPDNPAAILSYVVPPTFGPLSVGALVWAPLGARRVQGIVLELTDQRPGDFSIREILDRADPEAIAAPQQLALARWFSRTQAVRLWDALELTLPPGVQQELERTWRSSQSGLTIDLGTLDERERAVLFHLRRSGEQTETQLRLDLRGSDADLRRAYTALHEQGLIMLGSHITRPNVAPKREWSARPTVPDAALALAELGRAPRLAAVLQAVIEQATDGEGVLLPELRDVGATTTHLRTLALRGMVEIEQVEVRRDPLLGRIPALEYPPDLTLEQERGWRVIVAAQDTAARSGRAQPILLHGVTGSGKTELYLRAIGRAMRDGGQALVLVPEIALTTQLVRRFAARFPTQLAVLHSELGMGERYDEWRRLRRGDAQVVVGSRSAIWSPLADLKLIIVDEEHEGSFKHEATPFYHARDLALKLGELSGAVTILGSATPSIETAYAVQLGKMDVIELHERVGRRVVNGVARAESIPLPPVRIVDLRAELKAGVRSIFSRPLQSAIHRTLEAHEQTILFLNRRGMASFIMCRDCGETIQCPRCAISLAVHGTEGDASAPATLRCHYCGHVDWVPRNCPTCFGTRIRDFGVGTQRVVEEVKALFPSARVMRWDRDVTGRKGSHEALLDKFLRHEADIMVGTQMVAKGLDLPLVTLVGVITADTALNLPDFRSGERTFQLLAQVAGRAGRRSVGGTVIVQTYTPEHYAIQAAASHDYRQFYREEIAFRRSTHYPPFSRLIRFVTQSGSNKTAERVASELDAQIRATLEARKVKDWAIIGPAPAFLQKLRDRFRWHILVRLPDPAQLLDGFAVPRGWTVDVDPVSLL
jgi:primosomal protein N' (replication factor Y)